MHIINKIINPKNTEIRVLKALEIFKFFNISRFKESITYDTENEYEIINEITIFT